MTQPAFPKSADIDLTGSVAGEEDPGASIDLAVPVPPEGAPKPGGQAQPSDRSDAPTPTDRPTRD